MKKRIIAIGIVLALLVSFIPTALVSDLQLLAAQAETQGLKGDVDGSGEVNDWDEVVLSRHLAGWTDSTINETNADVDNNDIVDDWDEVVLSRYLADWFDEFPSESPTPTESPSPTPEDDIVISAGLADELTTGQEDAVEASATGYSGTPTITYRYTSTNPDVIAVNGNSVTALKAGSSVITVYASLAYEDGTVKEAMFKKTVTVKDNAAATVVADEEYVIEYVSRAANQATDAANVLAEKLGLTAQAYTSTAANAKQILVIQGNTAPYSTFTTSAKYNTLRDEGYIISVVDSRIAVIAVTDEGLDRGVRYLAKTYTNADGNLEVPAELEIISGAGEYIKSLTIAGNDISEYTILQPGSATSPMKASYRNASLNVLRKYIANATGHTLVIENGETSTATKYIKLVYDDSDELGSEGYRIEVVDGNVIITGGYERGLIYGAYEFIETYLGIKFMSTSPYYTEALNIDIPNGAAKTHVPSFEYRDVASTFFSNGTSINYAIPRKINSTDGNQSITAAWGGGIGTSPEHAHSFYLQFGIDPMEQPCLTAPGAVDTCYAHIVDYIEQKIARGIMPGETGLTQVTVAWNDNTAYCECAECRRVNAEEGGTYAGTYIRFVNEIADRLAVDYPGIDIFALAYSKARIAPKTAPRDNVVICYCWSGCDQHTYGETCECGDGLTTIPDYYGGGSNNDIEAGYYEEWAEMSDNMYVWMYVINYHWYLAPVPNMFDLREDFKYLADVGTKGIYSEGSTREKEYFYTFESARDYMISLLIWDPYMTEEEYENYLKEYLKYYYGDGYEYIFEYMKMQTAAGDAIEDCFVTNYDRPANMLSFRYYAENYDTMAELFDNALALADTAEQAEHVQRARLHVEFLSLCGSYDSMYVNGSEEEKAEYQARYEALWSYFHETGYRIVTSDPYGGLPETSEITANPYTMWYDLVYDPVTDRDNNA